MMNTTQQLANHLRQIYFGGNWTHSNIKQTLEDVSWQESLKEQNSFNSIATLSYHMHYYIVAVTKVLQGHPLDSSDKLSFIHPPINSQEDWDKLLKQMWEDAENFAQLIEKLPDNTLHLDFTDTKYGSYFRNLLGIIEHCHYHLGQIALIKKLVKPAL